MAKRPPHRIKTGLAAVPFEKGYDSVEFFFFQDLEKKEYIPILKEYAKKHYKKDELKAILQNKDQAFNYFNYAAMAYWLKAGLLLDGPLEKKAISLNEFFNKLIESGSTSTYSEEKNTDVVRISPAERLKMKIDDTIMQDINNLEDEWIDNLETEIDIYKLFKEYDLKGISAEIVSKRINRWLVDYSDAYNKTDEEMVEAYSHLTRKELKRRVDVCKKMIADLDKLKAVRRASKAPRTAKTKSGDKQVAKLNYKQNDSEYKLESINPIMIVGANKLYTFNTSTRKLSVYLNNTTDGFEVSGSTLRNFSVENSYTITLRKPDDVINIILSKKTSTVIQKALDELKTKRSPANGRINIDTILLKVIR